MNKLLAVINKLLHPPKWILFSMPWLVFAVLIFILATGQNNSTPAYIIYSMSAYSLVIWTLAIPKLIKQIQAAISSNKVIQKLFSLKIIRQYFNNLSFRGSISIYQGIASNLFYAIFRLITGICYASVWFLSMAVYYFVLCSLRTYLIICYHRYNSKMGVRCYQRTAFFLFLLNILMGGMILLMVQTNSGYSYPGYIIYVSAIYTCEIQEIWQPDFVCCKGSEFYLSNDVDFRITDSDDLPFFKKWRSLSKNDEYDYWWLRIRHCYSNCRIYASAQQKNQKGCEIN